MGQCWVEISYWVKLRTHYRIKENPFEHCRSISKISQSDCLWGFSSKTWSKYCQIQVKSQKYLCHNFTQRSSKLPECFFPTYIWVVQGQTLGHQVKSKEILLPFQLQHFVNSIVLIKLISTSASMNSMLLSNMGQEVKLGRTIKLQTKSRDHSASDDNKYWSPILYEWCFWSNMNVQEFPSGIKDKVELNKLL